MTTKTKLLSMMATSACLAMIACGGTPDKSAPQSSAQKVCEEAQSVCNSDVDGAVAKLKQLEDQCAKKLQDVCTAKDNAEVDSEACKTAAESCEADLQAFAKQQSELGKTCSDALADSCKPDELPAAPPKVDAACTAAQSTCKAGVEALHMKQEDLHATCGKSVQEACSAQTPDGCDGARKACEDAVQAMQDEAQKLTDTCSNGIEAACMTAAPKDTGAPSQPPVQGTAGTGSPADNSACEQALHSCETGSASGAQEANKSCETAVTSGCGPQGSAEACKAAHEQCKQAHEQAQSAFEAQATQCQKAISDACK